jgi:high affinity sulfate transporter 1
VIRRSTAPWTGGYDRAWLRSDLTAGVTVAAYLVPQVMAYAAIAGLPPVVGLWSILPALVLYAFVGSSSQLSVGPESTTALLTAVTVAPLADGDPVRYAALAALLALLVAAVALTAFALRLGFLADLLSRPVLVGYLTGVAVLMIISQLERVTGIPVDGDTVIAQVRSFAANVDEVDWAVVAVSSATLTLLLALGRWAPRWPGPLLAVLLATTAVAVFDLQDLGITTVGAIPAGLPVPELPAVSLADVEALAVPALGIAVVAYSDNVITARAFASRRGERIDGDTELLALGTVNVGTGLLQGMPVSSSGSRTTLGDAAGSRSQVYSLAAAATVLLVLLAGRGVLSSFPLPALGALVIYAALRLIDTEEFAKLARFRRSEMWLAVIAAAGVLLIGVLPGVGLAVTLSVLDMLRRIARPGDAVLGYVPGLLGMHDTADYAGSETVPGLVAYRYDAPLFFANADDFRTRALAAVASAPQPVRWFLLDAEGIVGIDSTAMEAFAGLIDDLRRQGITVAMARVRSELRSDLDRAGVLKQLGGDWIFPTMPAAVGAFTRDTG